MTNLLLLSALSLLSGLIVLCGFLHFSVIKSTQEIERELGEDYDSERR